MRCLTLLNIAALVTICDCAIASPITDTLTFWAGSTAATSSRHTPTIKETEIT